MLKIIIKTKKSLKEEISFSDPLFKQVRKFFIDFKKGKIKQDYKVFSLSIKDILSSDGEDSVLNGLVAYKYINILNKNLSVLKKHWSPASKKFDSIIKQEIKDITVPLIVRIEELKEGVKFSFSTYKKFSRVSLVMAININNKVDEEFDSDLGHELQHLTQAVKSLMVSYNQQLKNNSDDISKVRKINFSLQDKSYGLGKGEKIATFDKPYMERPSEYKPLIYTVMSRYSLWLLNNNIITKDMLSKAKFKEDYNQNKYLRTLSKLSPTQVDDMKDYSSLANDAIKNLLRDKDTRNKFAEQMGKRNLQFIALHMKKKHFVGELIKSLIERLKEAT